MTNVKLPSEKTHKVRNSLNYQPKEGKKFDLKAMPSLTVPDQTIPIRTLLERHSRGIPMPSATRIPIYDDNPDGDTLGINPKTLDLVDFQEISENNAAIINEYRQKAAKQQQLKKEAEKAEIETLRKLKAEHDAKAKQQSE